MPKSLRDIKYTVPPMQTTHVFPARAIDEFLVGVLAQQLQQYTIDDHSFGMAEVCITGTDHSVQDSRIYAQVFAQRTLPSDDLRTANTNARNVNPVIIVIITVDSTSV